MHIFRNHLEVLQSNDQVLNRKQIITTNRTEGLQVLLSTQKERLGGQCI